jgi:hypothetical protein
MKILLKILLIPVYFLSIFLAAIPHFCIISRRGMNQESLKFAQTFWLTAPALWLHSYIFLDGKQEFQTW